MDVVSILAIAASIASRKVAALKATATVGDGVTTGFTVAHNLNTTFVQVTVQSSETVPPTPTVTIPTPGTVVVSFDVPPAPSSVQVTIQ